MDTYIIYTLTGTDRIGLVEEVTQLFFDHGGNVEASRMIHLASEFAILMLVSVPPEQLTSLEMAMQTLIAQGYKVTTTQTKPPIIKVTAGLAFVPDRGARGRSRGHHP